MGNTGFRHATHLSIVWGVTLAVLTLMEWRSLDRDPLRQQILTPFIERKITLGDGPADALAAAHARDDMGSGQAAGAGVQYTVEFSFDGPLFLACFFAPVLAFHGIGFLLGRRNRG